MTQLAEVFDTDLATVTAYQESRQTFESWANTNELPADPIDAMQITLMRWQRDKFGDQSDERMALGVIEEVSESDIAPDLAEALDALGDATVYGSQLFTNNQLAIRPVLHFAQAMHERSVAMIEQDLDVAFTRQLVTAQGTLSQVILKGAQKVRGLDDPTKYRMRLVGSMMVCLVRCAMSAAIRGGSVVKISDVFLTVGRAVSQRGAGHDAIPKLAAH